MPRASGRAELGINTDAGHVEPGPPRLTYSSLHWCDWAFPLVEWHSNGERESFLPPEATD